MKTLKTLLFLVFISLSCFGQNKEKDTTKTYYVVYDFKNGKYVEGLIRPKVDRPIVYKIININRLAFDVSVNSSDLVVAETDWFTSTTELKKITELLTESKTTKDVLGKNTLDNNNLISNKNIDVKTKEEINKDIKNLKELDILKNELRLKEDELNSLLKKSEESKYKLLLKDDDSLVDLDLNSKIKSIVDQMNGIKSTISSHEKINNEKLIKFQEAKDKFYKAYYEFIKTYDRINTIITASNRVLPVSRLPFLSFKEYETNFRKEFVKIQIDLMTETTSVNVFNNAYTNLVVSYNKIKDIEDLNKIIDEKSITTIYEELDLLYDESKNIKLRVDLVNFEVLSQQILRIIHLLEKTDTYEYISAPIQPKNDIATFQVDIKAKNKDVEIDNSRKFTHNEFVRRGTRIDFSIGLAGSYFNNANVYEIYTTNGENKIGLKNKNLTVPSLITMISMTNRGSKYVAYGGSAGLGIDISNGRIQMSNFFIGPTLVLGKYDRMMFTSGVALRNVGKLKNGYELNSTVITESNDINTVLSDNYKLGFFVALTYNLTNNVREKISKFN